MLDPQDDGLSDIPDYNDLEDEAFPPLPPPYSPGHGGGQEEHFGAEQGDLSKLADVPAVKPKGVKRPQPRLDSQRLTSERGLPALRTLFADIRFKGRGHEAEDLRLLMQKMENWAHRLFPKLQFEDFIEKVEKLGSKKEVQTCLKRVRLDMPLTHEDFQDKEDAEAQLPAEVLHPLSSESAINVHSTPTPPAHAAPSLTEEQLNQIQLNWQRAMERKLARQHQMANVLNVSTEQDEKPEDLDLSSTHLPLCPATTDVEPPAERPAEPPAECPAEPPAECPAERPAECPAEPPAECPAEPPAECPAEPPAERPAEPPAECPAEPPAECPAEPPAERPAEPPAERPAEPPAECPAEPPAECPAEPPAECPAERPAECPAEPPAERPAEPPAECPAEPPAECPAEPPAECPAERPAECPAEPPAECPAERPAEPPAECPAEPPAECPAEPPAECPAEPPAECPAERPAEPPAECPAEPPAECPAEPPAKPPSERPVVSPAEPPADPCERSESLESPLSSRCWVED